MDDFDRATQIEEQLREAAILNAKRARVSAAESETVCQESDCGLPIPEARRHAAPGCKYCIECQTLRETRAKWRR